MRRAQPYFLVQENDPKRLWVLNSNIDIVHLFFDLLCCPEIKFDTLCISRTDVSHELNHYIVQLPFHVLLLYHMNLLGWLVGM